MRSGRKSAAQTKAPLKDRIKGSDINKKGSASSTAAAKDIVLSDEIIKALQDKADEFNQKNKQNKVSLSTLKAVFRRGAGAFSTSHRPNMTRNKWAYARVNKFLEKKEGKMVKKSYIQDNDLMKNGGITTSTYKTIASFDDSSVILYDGNLGYIDVLKLTNKLPKNIKNIEVVLKESSDLEALTIWSQEKVKESFGSEFESGFPMIYSTKEKGELNLKKAYGELKNGKKVIFDVDNLQWEEGDIEMANGGKIDLNGKKWYRKYNGADPFSYNKDARTKYGSGIYFSSQPNSRFDGEKEVEVTIDYKNPKIYESTKTIPNRNFIKDWRQNHSEDEMNKFVDGLFDGGYDAIIVKHGDTFGNELILRNNSLIKYEKGGQLSIDDNGLMDSVYLEIRDVFKNNGLKLEKNYSFTDGSNKSYLPHTGIYKTDGEVEKVGITYYDFGFEVLGEIIVEVQDNGAIDIKIEFPNWQVSEVISIFARGGQIDKMHKKIKEEMLNETFKSHKDIEQIANEKGVDLDYAEEQLRKGMKVESEHSNDPMVQEIIALQHLDEMIDYYDKLEFVEATMMENGGLIAPNGNKSNLTPEQYKLVRTPQFKAWFGDWENDPQNASKVVDDNGEPLMVYHGSKDENINIFSKGTNTTSGGGIYFTNSIVGASSYARKPKLYNVFLNIRNPKVVNANGRKWDEAVIDKSIWDLVKEAKDNNDGVIVNNVIDLGGYSQFLDSTQDDYIVYEPNQIKLADGTNTTFDMNNPDIRYKDGGQIDPDNKKTKDMITHKAGSAGGLLVGNRHSEGGIKAINKSSNTPLEMEGGEVVITRNAVSDEEKREFEGEMLTNREILSKINESGGGVSFEEGGSVDYGCDCDDKMVDGGELDKLNVGDFVMVKKDAIREKGAGDHLWTKKDIKGIVAKTTDGLYQIHKVDTKDKEIKYPKGYIGLFYKKDLYVPSEMAKGGDVSSNYIEIQHPFDDNRKSYHLLSDLKTKSDNRIGDDELLIVSDNLEEVVKKEDWDKFLKEKSIENFPTIGLYKYITLSDEEKKEWHWRAVKNHFSFTQPKNWKIIEGKVSEDPLGLGYDKMAKGGETLSSTEKLINYLKENGELNKGREGVAKDGTKYRYDRYTTKGESATNLVVSMFEKAAQENGKRYDTKFNYKDIYSIAYDRPQYKNVSNGKISMTELVEGDEMADGGEIDWGADLGDGFSIGNDVYITDIHSRFYDKNGYIVGKLGQSLVIRVGEDDMDAVVNKKYVQILNAPEFKKGGGVDIHSELKQFLQEQNTPIVVEEPIIEEIIIQEEVVEAPAEIMLFKEELTNDEDAPMIYVGSSIYANNSNGTDEWIVKSFTKDGVNLMHVPVSPLSHKHDDKHLSFDELKALFNNKTISIKFVLNERELNLILMILKEKLQKTTSFKDGGIVFVDKEGKDDEQIMESQFGNKQF